MIYHIHESLHCGRNNDILGGFSICFHLEIFDAEITCSSPAIVRRMSLCYENREIYMYIIT